MLPAREQALTVVALVDGGAPVGQNHNLRLPGRSVLVYCPMLPGIRLKAPRGEARQVLGVNATRFGVREISKGGNMKSAWKVGSSQIVVIVLVVLVAAFDLEACASAPMYTSKADLAGSAPIHSVLAVHNLRKDDFGFGMFGRGLRASLTSALDACGVKSRILQVDPTDLTLNERIEQNVQEFHPSAVLYIKIIRRETGIFRSQYGTAVTEEWTFDLGMLDVAANKQIWVARTMSKFKSKYIAPGMDFATSIVSRLRDDSVLKGCPTESTGWPIVPHLPRCGDERRAIVKQAQLTTDMAERKRLIDTMPICD